MRMNVHANVYLYIGTYVYKHISRYACIVLVWFKNFARVLRKISCGCGFSQGVAQDFLHDFCYCFCKAFSREKSFRMPPETIREGPRSVPGASQNCPRTSADSLAEQLQKNNAKSADLPLRNCYILDHFGTRPEPKNRQKIVLFAEP